MLPAMSGAADELAELLLRAAAGAVEIGLDGAWRAGAQGSEPEGPPSVPDEPPDTWAIGDDAAWQAFVDDPVTED